MKVVIDTNILLNAIFPNSKNYWIRTALHNEQLILCVTTDILNEYAEVFEEFYNQQTSQLFLSILELLPNLIHIKKYYSLRLIPQDEDDEKFADCAFAAGAEFLVTNDRHFNHLKQLNFPVFNIVNEDEFRLIFESRFGRIS